MCVIVHRIAFISHQETGRLATLCPRHGPEVFPAALAMPGSPSHPVLGNVDRHSACFCFSRATASVAKVVL